MMTKCLNKNWAELRERDHEEEEEQEIYTPV